MADDFDPHMILGISTESTWEEVRAAYVQLSKIYHPDRYSATALPVEVGDYLEALQIQTGVIVMPLFPLDKFHRRIVERKSPRRTRKRFALQSPQQFVHRPVRLQLFKLR